METSAGMVTSDWINLIAAILVGGGTLFLGIMAWRTIRQTGSIQKAERRERLLNEIIEWAIEILKCGTEWNIRDVALYSATIKHEIFLKRERQSLRDKFEVIYQKNLPYIQQLGSYFPEKTGLDDPIYKVSKHLYCHLRLLDLWIDSKIKNDKAIGKHKTRLDESAKALISKSASVMANL